MTKRKSRNNRRAQVAKPRNQAMYQAMVELRQGSRTTPVRSANVYRRDRKHKGSDWE